MFNDVVKYFNDAMLAFIEDGLRASAYNIYNVVMNKHQLILYIGIMSMINVFNTARMIKAAAAVVAVAGVPVALAAPALRVAPPRASLHWALPPPALTQ